jgi:hypothetical protein
VPYGGACSCSFSIRLWLPRHPGSSPPAHVTTPVLLRIGRFVRTAPAARGAASIARQLAYRGAVTFSTRHPDQIWDVVIMPRAPGTTWQGWRNKLRKQKAAPVNLHPFEPGHGLRIWVFKHYVTKQVIYSHTHRIHVRSEWHRLLPQAAIDPRMS